MGETTPCDVTKTRHFAPVKLPATEQAFKTVPPKGEKQSASRRPPSLACFASPARFACQGFALDTRSHPTAVWQERGSGGLLIPLVQVPRPSERAGSGVFGERQGRGAGTRISAPGRFQLWPPKTGPGTAFRSRSTRALAPSLTIVRCPTNPASAE